MQRGLVHAAAWSLATGAAVTLSWWGVHTVLSGTAYDPPRALPIPSNATSGSEPAGGAEPQSSSTRRPKSPSPSGMKTEKPPQTPNKPDADGDDTVESADTGSSQPSTRPPSTPPETPTATANVKSYAPQGGRVAFDLGESSAELVSATPDSGWQMQVWKQTEWIRVNFTKGENTTSVFCTWNGHPPKVEVVTE
ncbi:hypothetical protein ACH429_18530 [Streptomyces pathocidini]|uniref:Secreted protein n=1 Tax=Streptomyces pathocidini TaxID=1650571 RepID=A0ABW7UZA0_9ACTN|nr:hypothetical protein [Streptomyces pathocidini]